MQHEEPKRLLLAYCVEKFSSLAIRYKQALPQLFKTACIKRSLIGWRFDTSNNVEK